MIGHHQNRAAGWNSYLIGRSNANSDSHLSEQIFQAKSVRRSWCPLVQISYFADRS